MSLYKRLKYRYFNIDSMKSLIKGQIEHKKQVKKEIKTKTIKTKIKEDGFFGIELTTTSKPRGIKEIKKERNERIKEKIKCSGSRRDLYMQRKRKERCTESNYKGFIKRNNSLRREKKSIFKDFNNHFERQKDERVNSFIFELSDTYTFTSEYIKFFKTTFLFSCIRLEVDKKYMDSVAGNSYDRYCDGAWLILKDDKLKMTQDLFEKVNNKDEEPFIELSPYHFTKDIYEYCLENNLRLTAHIKEDMQRKIVIVYNEDYYKLLNY